MARPKLNIDANEVEKLASIGCSNDEIAAWFDCSKDTIEKRFSANLNKGRENGKTRLRRLQLQAAHKGNVAMLIWLGKQMLGQSDKVQNEITTPQAIKLSYSLDDESKDE